MEMIKNWDKIRKHTGKSIQSSLHASIAYVDAQNNPALTPIGSLYLNKDQTGYFFEIMTSRMPQKDRKVSILLVNSGLFFWFKSLFNSQFRAYPAIRLYGVLGKKRPATKTEIQRFRRQTRSFKRLKGYQHLWGDLHYVREITFTKFEKIDFGKMTKHL